MEEAAAETGSPSIQLSAEPGSEAAACFSWRDGWEVLRFFSSLLVTFPADLWACMDTKEEDQEGEKDEEEEEEGDAHQLLAF